MAALTPVARLGGRDVERAALGDAFNLAASGRLAIIILEGEAGIGKTSLLAEGLLIPQIGERSYVSRQTVQTHLVHVFAKLDISSRAQLAGEAPRREERTP